MEQIFPGLCEYRLLALEGKEPRLVVVFDETNVLRDGRLGDVESLGCLGEIHVFTDFQKRIDTEIQHRYRPLFLNHNINLWINKYISFFIMPGL